MKLPYNSMATSISKPPNTFEFGIWEGKKYLFKRLIWKINLIWPKVYYYVQPQGGRNVMFYLDIFLKKYLYLILLSFAKFLYIFHSISLKTQRYYFLGYLRYVSISNTLDVDSNFQQEEKWIVRQYNQK
jgi:hypothetical protein